MRCSILALALTLACSSAPGPPPAPAPQTPATGSQPQLGRAAEADPPEPEEPDDELDPEPIEAAVTSKPPLPEKLATIPDDPVATPNVRGTVVFAKSAQKDSATTLRSRPVA
jgi:hypothetical protein